MICCKPLTPGAFWAYFQVVAIHNSSFCRGCSQHADLQTFVSQCPESCAGSSEACSTVGEWNYGLPKLYCCSLDHL